MFAVRTHRVLCLHAVLALSVMQSASTAALAGADVGFVSSMQGKPQVLIPPGRLAPVTLMQTLSPGAMIVLRAKESVRFCHEAASKTFRIEGAGAVYVGDVGINREPGGPTIAETGVCNSSSIPSETGGVLLRSLRPPSSPK